MIAEFLFLGTEQTVTFADLLFITESISVGSRQTCAIAELPIKKKKLGKQLVLGKFGDSEIIVTGIFPHLRTFLLIPHE